MRPEENPLLSKRVGNVVCERNGVAGIGRSPDACFESWMTVAGIILRFALPSIKPFARNLITVFSTVNTLMGNSGGGGGFGSAKKPDRRTRIEAMKKQKCECTFQSVRRKALKKSIFLKRNKWLLQRVALRTDTENPERPVRGRRQARGEKFFRGERFHVSQKTICAKNFRLRTAQRKTVAIGDRHLRASRTVFQCSSSSIVAA